MRTESIERRFYPRYRLNVNVQLIITIGASLHHASGQAENISLGGILISCSRDAQHLLTQTPYPHTCKLNLLIEGDNYEIISKVISTHRTSQDDYKIRFKFDEFKTEQKTLLTNHLNTLSVGSTDQI